MTRSTSSAIAIIGAGHVGLVYAAGLASLGHRVIVVDIEARRVASLRRGRIWFHEPGLPELFLRGIQRGRITATTSYRVAVARSDLLFVCVPTPTTPDGDLDDAALRSAFSSIKRYAARRRPIVVNKSTVPVGTGDLATSLFDDDRIRVVSSPEFLAQGRAVEDFFHPRRVVIGTRDREAGRAVARVLRPLGGRIVMTDPVTAELSKLAANAMLAMRISYANALARIADRVGADMDALVRILTLDPRLGSGHLSPGLGYGGSCLPKDLAAVSHLSRRDGAAHAFFSAVAAINAEQRSAIVENLVSQWGDLAGRRVAMLGVAYKADTDDVRDSPAVALACELTARGVSVNAYDPAVTRQVAGIRRASSVYAAALGADAVIVATDWPEFRSLDLPRLRRQTRGEVFVDARRLFEPARVRAAGFAYLAFGIGARPGLS